MATIDETPTSAPHPPRDGMVAWLTTTDHKKIGILYMVMSIAFFIVSGIMAMLIRLELAEPGLQWLSRGNYNELFTMHGTGMLFFFATPLVFGFANYFIPLHIGAPDVAFPRVNALGFWLSLLGGLVAFGGFFTATGAAAFGWTGYPPLSGSTYSPGAGGDLWIVGIALSGAAGILGSVNLLATIFGMRAPGMTMFRMSIFSWNIVVTSVLVLFAFPALTAALAMLFIDRNFGGTFFDPIAGGDPVLYQHLFWFFGHPEVYIIILPFFGIITEVIPVFSRKPIFGYRGFVLATLLIGAYSFSVWAHHMYATGAVANPFFAATSMLIAVPTGIKFFNWIATMWRGKVRFDSPMLFVVGFLLSFLIGGITGIFLASPTIDFAVHDTYYVVAHFHYTIVGGTVFAMFAGFYYWIPKMSGKLMGEGLARLHFALFFVGFHLTFFAQFQLGLDGMQRRVADYPERFSGWNLLSTWGSVVLALGVLVFLINFFISMRRGKTAGDDPWEGHTLEWATTSPPPHHNFHRLPPIRSDRPVFDERTGRIGKGSDPP